MKVRMRLSALAVGASLVIVSSVSAASTLPHPINSDPYTNTSSQHKTQVEPDSFSFGNTIVAVTQTGRFTNGGSSNLAWSTSQDAGRTWTFGVLPGTTIYEGGPWDRISDPSVAYDPMHNVWIAAGLVLQSTRGAGVVVNRSTNGGTTWQNPVNVALTPSTFFDKSWITCDTWSQSPYYGHCYVEWDDNGLGNVVMMSTSTDGGLTWSSPISPSTPSGLGGQPVVQPNGTVVVPYTANYGAIYAFRSTNGGTSWTSGAFVASQDRHPVAGGMRNPPLPSAEVDGAGKVYVAWHDCAFRSGCSQNDIVMSTSTDGVAWSSLIRIPIDPVTSTVDHFLPGIGVDKSTSGSSAHIGIGYYYFPVSNCFGSTCHLTYGFISSHDGGATWSAPRQASHEMDTSWIASTNQGQMVGDYTSVSFAGGTAHPVFAIAKAPSGGLNEQLATATFDVTSVRSAARATRAKPVLRARRHAWRTAKAVTAN